MIALEISLNFILFYLLAHDDFFFFLLMQDFCDFMQEMLSMMNNVKDEVAFIYLFTFYKN